MTKTCSQVKHLNDSGKMVPDNQPVTEWFQLSSPSARGCEGDGGKFVFFFFPMCMMEMRWVGRVHDGERRQRQMRMLTQVHTGSAISPKRGQYCLTQGAPVPS